MFVYVFGNLLAFLGGREKFAYIGLIGGGCFLRSRKIYIETSIGFYIFTYFVKISSDNFM